MNIKEAIAWLTGKRSRANYITQDPFETWQVRVAQADAAMIEQAYWVAKAYKEGMLSDLSVENKMSHKDIKEAVNTMIAEEIKTVCPKCGEPHPVLHCENCGHNWEED